MVRWLTLESLWPTDFVLVLVGLIVAWAICWAMWREWLEHRAMEPLPDTNERRRLMLRYQRAQRERMRQDL